MKIADIANFRYTSANGVDGVCHMRLYEVNGRRIALVSEGDTSDGFGVSITNAIAQIATTIARQYGWLDLLIEHYPPHGGHFHPSDERLDFVEGLRWLPLRRQFTDTPDWKSANRAQVEALIRERL